MRDWFTRQKSSPEEAATVEFRSPEKVTEVFNAISAVVRGKPEAVKMALVTLIARGHLLIEDVPGIGKTTLANALARSLSLSFNRIQFTADLLPSDVVGVSVFDPRAATFDFKPGPVFSNILLADEVNRATPKTQSALLEAMAEQQVTIDGETRKLDDPFFVIATQNPSEHQGTYPLPESQLDRFLLRIEIGYPSNADERSILRDRTNANPLNFLQPILAREELLDLQAQAEKIHVDDAILDYLLRIVEATRTAPQVELGVSPRGSLALFRAAQALALVEGREYCIPDDVKRLVVRCFSHRIITTGRALRSRNREAEHILNEILSNTAVPD